MVHASINGTDALFVADSGAFYSILTPVGAAEFGLTLRSPPRGFVLHGIGGTTDTMLTTINRSPSLVCRSPRWNSSSPGTT